MALSTIRAMINGTRNGAADIDVSVLPQTVQHLFQAWSAPLGQIARKVAAVRFPERPPAAFLRTPSPRRGTPPSRSTPPPSSGTGRTASSALSELADDVREEPGGGLVGLAGTDADRGQPEHSKLDR